MTLFARRAVRALGFVGLGAVWSAPTFAQQPSAEQIVAETRAKYASLKSYSDDGETTASTSEKGAVVYERTTSFRIKMARPAMYSVAWSQPSPVYSRHGAAWSDGQHRSLDSANRVLHPLNDDATLAAAGAVSSGATRTVPTLFLGAFFNSLSPRLVLKGEEPLEGDDCYVLTSTLQGTVETVWISKTSKLLKRFARISEGRDPPVREVSEAEARRVLVDSGQEATRQAILRTRDLLSKSVPSLVGKTFTSVETHRNIRLDEPLTQADFQEEMKIP